MKFVVIGGDAAGMSAASKAKRNDPAIDVVVLEQTSDVSYSACGMPYNIAEPERDMNDLVVRQAHVFRDKQGIDLRLGHRVETDQSRSQDRVGPNPGRTALRSQLRQTSYCYRRSSANAQHTGGGFAGRQGPKIIGRRAPYQAVHGCSSR